MFYDNYIKLCNSKGISPSAAAEEMGFMRSVVTRWSKGATPRRATIQKIADYFDVTVSELDGEQKEKPVPDWDGKNKERLLSAIKGINDMDLLLYVLDEVNKKIQEINKNDK